jgi:amidophosphoribosyltransferase
MANLTDFIAFKAAIELLRDTRQERIINEVYRKSKAQEHFEKEKIINYVKEIYQPFSNERISDKISQLLTPDVMKMKVHILYQTIDDLHEACPNHLGDWYFTGDYPTPGGNKVVNTAFINFIEKRKGRSY